MSKTNSKLKAIIGQQSPNPRLVSANQIGKPDTINKQGLPAYKQDKWLLLLTLLNTSKLEPQYYRSQTGTLEDLKKVIDECAKEDAYLTCQCIVWSRCLGEGMRTISHAASVFIAPYISGRNFSKRFYSLWDRTNKKGGVIYRPDDMLEILEGFKALNDKLSNPIRKGFKSALEGLDTYQLLKYRKDLIDVINLVHPAIEKSLAKVTYKGKLVPTLEAVIKGYSVSAETWETSQSEAGQIVAQAVKEGKYTSEEAQQILTEAKAENWKELLENNKLGILASIRNLRNILLTNPDVETMDLLCDLVSNGEKIRQGKIFPYQIDIANELMTSEFSDLNSRRISQALLKGYLAAIPNLSALLPGRNLIILDASGSMGTPILIGRKTLRTTCSQKAALIAATIAKATNADLIIFGGHAEYISYNINQDVFTIAKKLSSKEFGSTNLGAAWKLASQSKRQYDRVFILSDNEVNVGRTYDAYTQYVQQVGNPYVYSVDLAGYGTNCIAGPKVRYYYGYGFSMFEDIATVEFNASNALEKVKQIII